MGSGGGGPSEPMASGTGRATQLGPEQMNPDGWEVGGQEAGHLPLLRGRHLQLVWPGVVWQEGVAWQMRKEKGHSKGA